MAGFKKNLNEAWIKFGSCAKQRIGSDIKREIWLIVFANVQHRADSLGLKSALHFKNNSARLEHYIEFTGH